MHSSTFCTLLGTICFLNADLIFKFSIKFMGTLSDFLLQLIFLQNTWNFHRVLYMGVGTSTVTLSSIYFYILYMLHMCKFNLKSWNTVNSCLIGKIEIRLTGYGLISLFSNRDKELWALQLHRVSHAKSVLPIWSFFQ